MRFKLKPFTRDIPDSDFLADIRRVANDLNKDTLSMAEYESHGEYTVSVLCKRFGSWTKILDIVGLRVAIRRGMVTDDELLQDLKRVADEFHQSTVTAADYNSVGKYHSDRFRKVFGTWFKALDTAGLERTRTLGVTNEDYFKNLEAVWMRVGRQPVGSDMVKPVSKYSVSAYCGRFGTWRKALEAFVEYINSEAEGSNEEPPQVSVASGELGVPELGFIKHKTGRTINWRLRFIVMKRDNFRCQSCGRSPATDPSVILHVDHIKAWANGGETLLDNLQTLCSVCNIGKGAL